MRIAYLTNQYPATSHTFIRREIAALEQRGHTISRYAVRASESILADPADRIELLKTDHILGQGYSKIVFLAAGEALKRPVRTLKAFRLMLQFASASQRGMLRHLAYMVEALVVSHWCRRDRVQHLHVHFGTNPATVGALVNEVTGIPFSFTVHGPEEFDNPRLHALGQKVQRASFAVAISSFGKSQLMRWADSADWDKIHVVHCGLDEAYLKEPAAKASDEPRLLCIARLSEQKGHLVLLQAARLLRDRGIAFSLTLGGDGPMRGEIEATIQRLRLEDCVRIAGWISQAQISEELAASRATVLPSFAEGLPVVLMESMALQRPPITTYVAGIPELVWPDAGWLVPAGDAEALAEALQAAIQADPETLREMGNRARDRALARHGIKHSAMLLERHIAKVALRSGSVNLAAAPLSGQAMADEVP